MFLSLWIALLGLAKIIISADSEAQSPVASLVTAQPPPVRKPPTSDGLDFQKPVAFPASGTWTAIECHHTGLTDNSIPFDEQWKTAGADQAWEQLLTAWQKNQQSNVVAQNFSDFAYNVFHYAPLSDCQNIDSTTCGVQVECGNRAGAPPAAALIINSFVAMHEIAKQQFVALASGINAIQGQVMQMATTFAQQPPKDPSMEILKVVLDVLTLGIGIGAAFVWNIAFDVLKVLASNTALRSALKDSFNAGVAFAFVVNKDVLKPAKDDSGTADNMNAYVSEYYTQLQAVNTAYIYNLMAGRDNETLSQLSGLVQGGAILDVLQQGGNNIFNALTDNIAALMYGRLIPAAWSVAPKGYSPFILRVDKSQRTCGDDLPNHNDDSDQGMPLGFMMTDDTANKTSWCDPEGNSWFLLSGHYSPPCTLRVCSPKGGGDMPFQAMDGGDRDTLDGTQWGHLKLEDIFISAYTGFLQNGQANGFELNTTSSGIGNEDFTITEGQDNGLVLSGGVRTPGFFNFTICLDPQEAYRTVTSVWTLNDHSAPICAQHPSAGGSKDIGPPGSFSPGTCGVHVTQYQRNEKTKNLLSVYQTQITITDANNRIIGSATKQPSSSPLIVVDTVLPFSLIVATPGPDDFSPVQFWYADQSWDSNDLNHRCKFGAYDNGDRDGDCLFSCPMPMKGEEAKASATISAKLPGQPTNAIGGAETFTNTWTTSISPSSTSTSEASKPTTMPGPGYATGRCVFHLTQYQRNEPADINPTSDFAIEITLFDASQPPNVIATSGKVQAPMGVGVPVKGKLVGTLWITTQSDDKDPLLFGYDGGGGKNFTMDEQCQTGKEEYGYEGGKREMDCGFTCDP